MIMKKYQVSISVELKKKFCSKNKYNLFCAVYFTVLSSDYYYYYYYYYYYMYTMNAKQILMYVSTIVS